MQLSGRGVALSIIASCLFAVIPGYALYLGPLDGVQVFAPPAYFMVFTGGVYNVACAGSSIRT